MTNVEVVPEPPSRVEQDDSIRLITDNAQRIMTWNYDRDRGQLVTLYNKAMASQWNSVTDLDWATDVDPEKLVMTNPSPVQRIIAAATKIPGSPIRSWGEKELTTAGVEFMKASLSQFMHGEQGAMLTAAKIVETVPWIDAKYYAASQVMDEARHVEVFARYLDTKLDGHYPVNANLQLLIDDILGDSRWDMTYMGMQIMVEGLALAAFGFMHQMTTEPLLKKLLRYVMSDEARHVAFGVLSLQEFYQELNSSEIRERQEFAFEAAVRMRDRFLQQEVWERMGVDVKEALTLVLQDDGRKMFQNILFSKIVPNCKKLGLLDAADGWLRERFTELGVIQFEDWVDTGAEYDSLDEVASDRAAASA